MRNLLKPCVDIFLILTGNRIDTHKKNTTCWTFGGRPQVELRREGHPMLLSILLDKILYALMNKIINTFSPFSISVDICLTKNS